jgi:hypothetical protein
LIVKLKTTIAAGETWTNKVIQVQGEIAMIPPNVFATIFHVSFMLFFYTYPHTLSD